jgi:hypothetical protein
MVELWKNPDTSASFVSQTIELDLSKYHYIVVRAKYDVGGRDDASLATNGMAQVFINKGINNPNAESAMIIAQNPTTGTLARRVVTVTDNYVFFEVGEVHNTTPIPIAIYGIEKVE